MPTALSALSVSLHVRLPDVALGALGLAEPEVGDVLLDRRDHLLPARDGEGETVAQGGRSGCSGSSSRTRVHRTGSSRSM